MKISWQAIARRLGLPAPRRHRNGLVWYVLTVAVSGGVAHGADKHWTSNQGYFQNPTEWSSNSVPGLADHAFLGDLPAAYGGTVTSNADIVVGSLDVSHAKTLVNGISHLGQLDEAHMVYVAGTTRLQSDLASPSTYLVIYDDPASPLDFQTGAAGNDATLALSVLGSAILDMQGGLAVATGKSEFGVGTTLIGNGEMRFLRNAAGSPSLSMDGVISPGNNGGLTLTQLGSSPLALSGQVRTDDDDTYTIDLDSFGNDAVKHQSLTVNATAITPYDESIRMKGNTVVAMNVTQGWTMTDQSRLLFTANNDAPGPAVLSGGKLTFGGTMLFDRPNTNWAPAHGQIDADVVFTPTANVEMKSDDQLTLNGSAVVNGGTYSLLFGSWIDFNGPTTMHGGDFSMPNSVPTGVYFNGSTTWSGTVDFNGTAHQNGAATVASASTINGKAFDFDGDTGHAWTINAPLAMNVDSLESPGDMTSNRVDGPITVNAAGFDPSYLQVNLPAGKGWIADAPLTLNGPSAPFAATTLRGSPVTISNALTSNGNNVTTARLTLDASATAGIAVGGSLRLAGGSLIDPNLIQDGSIVGAGTLAANAGVALVGRGLINNPVDFDGTAELRAKGGTLTLSGAIQDVGVIGTADSTGILNVVNTWNSGAADKVELAGGSLIGGPLVNGGQVVGRGLLAPRTLANSGKLAPSGGELVVTTTTPSGTDLDGQSENGVLEVVAGDLRVTRTPSDAFNGQAIVESGRTLQFDNGWTHNGVLTMFGSAASPARLTGGGAHHLNGQLIVSGTAEISAVADFGPASILNMAIGGTSAGEWDALSLTAPATLGGTLALSLKDSFIPALGDPLLEVMSLPAGFTGSFGSLLSPIGMPAGLAYRALYSPTAVQLEVVSTTILGADFNEDGSVDTADFGSWTGGFGTFGGATHATGDADVDGNVDGADFLTWQRQLGFHSIVPQAATVGAAGVPEPATGSLTILATAAIAPALRTPRLRRSIRRTDGA